MGTIFKVTKTGVLTTLAAFTGTTGVVKGASPLAGLALGNDGNFYGSTSSGGAGNFGTVFKITPTGSFATLVELTGTAGAARGNHPAGRLLRDSAGNFLGTTENGGASNAGTIFKVTPAGAFTSLLEFTQTNIAPKGKWPRSGLIAGPDGNYYGCTDAGGAFDEGTVFRLSPAGVLATVVEFTGDTGSVPGSQPSGDLLLQPDGNFYGTTKGGGSGFQGTVFKLTSTGVLTTLALFGTGAQPGQPRNLAGGVLPALDGGFYFTTGDGGSADFGTVVKLSPGGTAATLVNFTGLSGDTPSGELIFGADGNLYGTTESGGPLGHGTVFKMTPQGALTTIVQFTNFSGAMPGERPASGLFKASDGNFYGTAKVGGTTGSGTIFKLTLAGVFTNLIHFTGPSGAAKGGYSEAALIEGADGLLYGTTSGGGLNGFGTIFKLTKSGVFTNLVEFTNDSGIKRGRSPISSLVQGSDGSFYGTTPVGGTWGYGTIFKVTSSGVFTTIADFSSDAPPTFGTSPSSSLFRAPDGNLYGATRGLGTPSDFGTVYRLTPTDVLTNIVLFTGDGTQPDAGSGPNMPSFAMGPDGNLYGTTGGGGPGGGGTIFRLRFGPTPATLPATIVASGSAQVNATVNPNGTATTAIFEWGASPAALTNATSVAAVGAGAVVVTLSRSLSGLLPGTTYYFRVKAENGEQFAPQFGAVRSFTTNAPPTGGTLTIVPASPVSPGAAFTVSAENWADPNGPLTYQFFLDGSPLSAPGASSSVTLTAPTALGSHAMKVRVFDAIGDFAEASLAFDVNTAPVARIATLGAMSGSATNLAAAKLILYASDADGDAIQLIAVNPASTHGGTIAFANGLITYTPPPGYTGADSFTYTIRDVRGATAIGTVNVEVSASNAPSLNTVAISPTAAGFLLKFAGIPGTSYVIQFRDSLSAPWQTLTPPGPIMAGPNGLFEFEDKPNPLPPSRFYRAAQLQ